MGFLSFLVFLTARGSARMGDGRSNPKLHIRAFWLLRPCVRRTNLCVQGRYRVALPCFNLGCRRPRDESHGCVSLLVLPKRCTDFCVRSCVLSCPGIRAASPAPNVWFR